MISICELCDMLPINFDNYTLRLLTFKDLDWYVHNLREGYYNKYLDFNFGKDIRLDKLQSIMYNLTVGYHIKATSVSEVRLVLVDNSTKDIIGGCTIVEKFYGEELEIAYFVLPKFSGKGLGTKMVNNLVIHLKKSKVPFERVCAIIQQRNAASAKLLTNIGFKLSISVDGRYCKNDVYYLHKDDIKIKKDSRNINGRKNYKKQCKN